MLLLRGLLHLNFQAINRLDASASARDERVGVGLERRLGQARARPQRRGAGDPDAVARVLWQLTHEEYRQAAQTYLNVKTAAAVRTKEEDTSPDFAEEKPQAHLDYALPAFHLDRKDWEDRVRRYSGYFRKYPEIYSSAVMVLGEKTQVRFVSSDGGQLVIAGITDRASRRRGHPVRDLAAVLEGVPSGAPVILLDHQPSDARHAAKSGVALQLSGHTHGGLIVGLDRLAARANAGYVSGRYDVDGMTLYVNNGTALWPGFALRLGRPSELTRITLRQAGTA